MHTIYLIYSSLFSADDLGCERLNFMFLLCSWYLSVAKDLGSILSRSTKIWWTCKRTTFIWRAHWISRLVKIRFLLRIRVGWSSEACDTSLSYYAFSRVLSSWVLQAANVTQHSYHHLPILHSICDLTISLPAAPISKLFQCTDDFSKSAPLYQTSRLMLLPSHIEPDMTALHPKSVLSLLMPAG